MLESRAPKSHFENSLEHCCNARQSIAYRLSYSCSDDVCHRLVGHGESPAAPSAPVAFSPLAEALPFPPDAREVEFDATFDEIEYRSSSSMSALAAFYRQELASRGWALEDESIVVEDDSVEMTFFHDGYQVDVDLDERSDDVAVSIECEGLDFSHSNDPAKLVAAGVPQSRAYLFLQKELPRPEIVDGESYRSDACHFKSPLQLQAAFDFYVQALKQSGWRETAPTNRDGRSALYGIQEGAHRSRREHFLRRRWFAHHPGLRE